MPTPTVTKSATNQDVGLRALWSARKRPIVLLTVILALGLWAVVLVRQAQGARVQRHIDAGIDDIRAGQPREAEREWLEAARLNPNNVAVWELLSDLYINTSQWSKGSNALRHLERVAPNRRSLYARMAACALRNANEPEAQRLAQEELKRNPNDSPSLAILAFLSGMQENFEQQIAYLQRLLARNPNDPDTLTDLAEAYNDAGKFADILPVADRLVAIKPQDGIAYAMRAAARFETDASPAASAQAETDLQNSLKIDPLSGFARYTLGRLYLRQHKYPQAIFQLELAQKLFPRKMDVPFELATAYARSGQSGKAAKARQRFEALRQEASLVSALQKRCSLEPDNFDAHLHLGEITLQSGDVRKAYYYLQRALALNPRSAAANEAHRQMMAQFKDRVLSGQQ